jgi:hypothetical protein
VHTIVENVDPARSVKPGGRTSCGSIAAAATFSSTAQGARRVVGAEGGWRFASGDNFTGRKPATF